jgi:hypothetical protein
MVRVFFFASSLNSLCGSAWFAELMHRSRFGFNGGSALAANLRAFQAIMVTNTAAAVGGLTWLLLDYWQERKWSPVGFCSGAIAGLVGITPASGYVGTPASVAIGMITAVVCNYSTKLKIILQCDDALGKPASPCQNLTFYAFTDLPSMAFPFLFSRYLCLAWYRWLRRLNLDRHICRPSRRGIRWNDCDPRWMDQSPLHANSLSTG